MVAGFILSAGGVIGFLGSNEDVVGSLNAVNRMIEAV